MSRYLDTSFSASGQPFGTDANDWMQDAYNEQTAASVIAWIGEQYNASYVYLLYGGVLSSSAGTTSVTAGKVFSNGVFYDLLATTYPDPSGGDTNVVNNQITYGDGAGTSFRDSSVHNVEVLHQMICAAGAPGSGDVGNYVDLIPLSNYAADGGSLTGTFAFNRNQYLRLASTTGADVITTSTTYGRIGCEVILFANCTAGDTVSFAGAGGLPVTGVASLTAASGAVSWVIKMKLISLGAGVKVMAEIYSVVP